MNPEEKTIKIDTNLLQKALELSHQSNPDSLIHEALQEYIQYRKQLKIIDLFGTIDYEENYDYKKQRERQ